MKRFKDSFIVTFVTGALLLAGCVLLINMIADNFHGGRFDLTGDRLYTMSPSVKHILTELEAPIEVTYYVSSSEKMPTQWKNLERDVIDKLQELQLASRGKMSFSVFDPTKAEAEEAVQEQEESEEAKGLFEKKSNKARRQRIAERLYEKGVIPIGVRSASQDEIAVKRVYSSIVLSYLDRKEEVIAEVRPETFGSLEYDIITRVYKLISTKKPRVAFFPGKPDMPPQSYQYFQQQQPRDNYSVAVKLLKQAGYSVERTNITKNEPIPQDIKTLVIMLDTPLDQRQLFEIDKFIHGGGHVILAGQQYNYRIMPSRAHPGEFDLAGMPLRLNMNDLANNLGFEVGMNMFMDKSSAFIQVPVYQTRNVGGMQFRQQRMEPVTKPVIIKVLPQNINRKLSVSNNISELFYMYGSRLIVHEDTMEKDSLEYHVLFSSSKQSWTGMNQGWGPVNTTPPPSERFLGNQPLGLYVSGTFRSKFRDTPAPPWKEDETGSVAADDTAAFSGEPAPSQVIALGCSNMFKDDVIQYVENHQRLLLNCVDALSLGDELIHIRSKHVTARRIKEISSAGKAVSKGVIVFLTPLLFAAGGIYISIRRKTRARELMTSREV